MKSIQEGVGRLPWGKQVFPIVGNMINRKYRSIFATCRKASSNFGKQNHQCMFFQFWQTGKNSFPQFHHVFRSRISISAAMFFWSQHVWPIHIILTCVCCMLRHIHMHRASLNLVCVCHCASISDDLYCIYYSNMVHMSYTMLFWNCFDLSFFFAPGIVITWLFAGVAMDVHPKKMVVTMWPAKRYKLVCKPMKTTIQQL